MKTSAPIAVVAVLLATGAAMPDASAQTTNTPAAAEPPASGADAGLQEVLVTANKRASNPCWIPRWPSRRSARSS